MPASILEVGFYFLSCQHKANRLKKIIVSVTNDLTTDQRVKKVCDTLGNLGFKILLVGRKLPNSLPLQRNYTTKRIQLLFNKGFLFYTEYNIRLFFFLLFTKKDLLLSNDLDTLLPNYLVSKIQGKKLVYDSHELFTEIPELTQRPLVKKIWLTIEKWIFPKLKNCYTVNHKIAEIYAEKYGIQVKVIRNIAKKEPYKNQNQQLIHKIKAQNKGKKMLILQGTGINVDRGAEEAVLMMQYVKNAILYIVGGGDVFPKIKQLVKDKNLDDSVIIVDKIPYEELKTYTHLADIGLSLDKNTSLNYEYSLPNKIFDYIQAETPLLVSNRVVVAQIVTKEHIGKVITHINVKHLAKTINEIFENKQEYQNWKENLRKVSNIYTWQNEAVELKKIYSNLQ